MNTAKYADDDRSLLEDLLRVDIHRYIPSITSDLYPYFSLSHTKLIYHEPSKATLYFKCPEEEVFFQRTIYVQEEKYKKQIQKIIINDQALTIL